MSKISLKWYHLKIISSIIAGLGLAVLLTYSFFYVDNKNKLLDKYGKYEIAIITNKNITYRAKVYVHYEFVVNGQNYRSSRLYYSSYGHVEVGYKFQVVYYPEDPTINKLLYDKRIKEKPKWIEELKKEYNKND